MIDTLTQGAVGWGVLAGALFTGWQSWQARKQASHANTNAQQAADNAKPVSNGFSAKVLTSLDHITGEMAAMRSDMRVMSDRQNGVDQRINSLGDLVARHITNDHAREAA